MLDVMKVIILYRPKSAHGTEVETFIHDFSKIHDGGEKLEVVDADSANGISIAELYDIVEFPAILAVDDRGSLLKGWMGSSLPLSNEVAYYVQ